MFLKVVFAPNLAISSPDRLPSTVIWNILPDRLKNVNSIEAFKIQIKKWKPENYPRRLCKVYVQNVGFV